MISFSFNESKIIISSLNPQTILQSVGNVFFILSEQSSSVVRKYKSKEQFLNAPLAISVNVSGTTKTDKFLYLENVTL